jgi:quinoprotein glucose dehydrogenase
LPVLTATFLAVTAGGVAFLSSALDYYLRAYDLASGRELWRARLPAGGQTTPMTYRSPKSGRQFVLTVAGGHGSLGTELGDYVVAYALPRGSAATR